MLTISIDLDRRQVGMHLYHMLLQPPRAAAGTLGTVHVVHAVALPTVTRRVVRAAVPASCGEPRQQRRPLAVCYEAVQDDDAAGVLSLAAAV